MYAYTRRSRIGNTLDAKLDADRAMRVFPCRNSPGAAGVDIYGMRGIYTSAGRGGGGKYARTTRIETKRVAGEHRR